MLPLGGVYEFQLTHAFPQRARLIVSSISCGAILAGATQGVSCRHGGLWTRLSGQAVRRVLDFYKISPANLIVVSDDVALDFASFRFRDKGSAGGHNGLKDIESHLGTQEYQRLRVGIGDREHGRLEDYVLTAFNAEEQKLLPDVIEEGVEFLNKWLMKET